MQSTDSLSKRVRAMGLHRRRMNPHMRARAEQQVFKMRIDGWMNVHNLVRRVEVSPAQRIALREVFDMIDADHGGTIDLDEMSVIMRAQGFSLPEIREAMRVGDTNGDGELDFEEFVDLVGGMGQGRPAGTTSHVAGPAGDTFPFKLVAGGYRITQLIDEMKPAVREAALLSRLNPATRQAIAAVGGVDTTLPPIAGAEPRA